MGAARAVTAVLLRPEVRAGASDWVVLARPRLNAVVVLTAGVAFGAASGHSDGWRLLATLAGTALVAAGASAANQVLEREVDAQMRRTRRRPLPSGRLAPHDAARVAAAAAVGGCFLLATTTLLAAGIAAATFVGYVAVYTPLKRVTPWALVVGAVPGAAPMLIGWTAATGVLDRGAWVLFAILFCWQVPHFVAIAWLYREDYARAAIRAWTVEQPDGRIAARHAVAFAIALVGASALLGRVGLLATPFAAATVAVSGVLAALAVAFARQRTARTARSLLLGSLVHVIVLCVLIALGSFR